MSDSEEYAERVARVQMDNRSEQLRRGEIGFAKGTLVHASEGLRAIDGIGVGDLVLTAEAPGADPAFGPVVRITHAPAQVIRVIYHEPGNEVHGEIVDTTLNHLFWVIGDGWTEARKLFSGFGNERRLLRQDGREMVADCVKLVVATGAEGIGWIPYSANALDEMGYEWNFASRATHRSDVSGPEDVYEIWDAPFLFGVYELEVEGSGIYFVGEEGLLVRHHLGIPIP